MVLKLDPRLPMVWRSTDTLQLGVDAPPVVLRDLTNASERMIAALAVGISRSGLEMIGRAAGAGADDIASLLRAVSPALEKQRTAEQDAVTIVGGGPTVDRLADILRRSARRLVEDGEHTDLAVIVAHYVVEPDLYGYWLRRDIPHLPVVYGDTTVRIGPIVEPGAGPCLYCLDRYRTDADPAWPTIASQLWGRSSPVETTLVVEEVAALATRLLLRRRTDRSAASVDLAAETGETTWRRWSPHPDCGCIGVDAARLRAVSG
ncbi:TOMM precursor leader peptide-binding protein [Glaciihabitans sp. UYNi722]|uniref:TOMM precursor leader peptide-binding protein n=1 Tax=Glaciihabitans sp. UYNi722 TaxID=3156344 RepID=UPI00339B72FD